MSHLYQAVLFDLDGTLLNTLQDLAEAVNHGLRKMGLPERGLAEFRYMVGEGREEMVRRALPEEAREADNVSRLVELVNRYYREHWQDHTRLYDGIPELLDALVERGLTLTIFSNKPQEFTEQNVAGLLSNWPFARVLGASPEVPHKPDCRGALRIAGELGIQPERFLYLGDSGVDMLTARRAGMQAIGALWGFRDRQELLENGAQGLIERPAELLKWLDKISPTEH